MNSKYWENFYKTFKLKKPSSFAKFVLDFLKTKDVSSIADFGCGNGRDSEFFFNNGFSVVGIDKFMPNEQRSAKPVFFKGKKIILSYVKEDINDCHFIRDIDVAYCRFLFHAINEETEDSLLDLCSGTKVKIICAEYRNVFDHSERVFENHERRLIDDLVFQRKLIGRDYRIVYFATGKGFAKFKGEDPNVSRIIAIKK